MNEKRPQSFVNHSRTDPWFHFVIVPLLALCFAASVHLFMREEHPHLLLPVFTLTVLMLAFRGRTYALKVQDRVIRLGNGYV